MASVSFKYPHVEGQYNSRPKKLIEVCEFFIKWSLGLGITPVITRVLDPEKGESGVHPAGRAVDFRNEMAAEKSSVFLYTPEQAQQIVDEINKRFPRKDGKLVCIHHAVQGSTLHFHIQIPASWV